MNLLNLFIVLYLSSDLAQLGLCQPTTENVEEFEDTTMSADTSRIDRYMERLQQNPHCKVKKCRCFWLKNKNMFYDPELNMCAEFFTVENNCVTDKECRRGAICENGQCIKVEDDMLLVEELPQVEEDFHILDKRRAREYIKAKIEQNIARMELFKQRMFSRIKEHMAKIKNLEQKMLWKMNLRGGKRKHRSSEELTDSQSEAMTTKVMPEIQVEMAKTEVMPEIQVEMAKTEVMPEIQVEMAKTEVMPTRAE